MGKELDEQIEVLQYVDSVLRNVLTTLKVTEFTETKFIESAKILEDSISDALGDAYIERFKTSEEVESANSAREHYSTYGRQ